MTTDAANYFESAYANEGFAAQRQYPNEELLRFLGRNFFDVPKVDRSGVNILEVGSGSGANLWAIAREGFTAHGLELSESAVRLCRQMLDEWGVVADVRNGNMLDIPFEDGRFDAIVDVLAAYCLDEAAFDALLGAVAAKLKPGGQFFTYTLGKGSDDFRLSREKDRLEGSTLNGLARETSPFYGNNYPIRFLGIDEVERLFAAHGLGVEYCETISRTYRRRTELVEFVVAVGRKS